MGKKAMLIGFLTAALTAAAQAAGVTAIRNVRLFDGTKVIPNATVVFSEGVVTAAGTAAKVPEGAAVIDGTGKTLLPGLIDSHTHVFPYGSLERALRFGVTTELDMFTSVETMKKLKVPATDRADFLSAGICVTVAGGHGSEYFPIPTYTPGSDAQAFIDARIAEGSDYIKLIYDDGSSFGLKWSSLTKDDLELLIAAAHKRGKMAVVHTSSLAFARNAIEAGADGLVHLFGNTAPDKEFGAFVARHRAFVIPTLTVVESASGTASGASLATDPRLKPFLNGAEIEGLNASFPKRPGSGVEENNAADAVRQLRAARVPLLVGTDAPNPGTSHGVSIHRELELLVKAGLTPVEALTAATSVPAATFGLKDRGRISKGTRADLLLVNGDPTTDIMATRDIVTVWKGGVAAARQKEAPEAQRLTETIALDKLPGGIISDFEGGDATSRFGFGWQTSTDSIAGGKSTAEMKVAGGALHVTTDTKEGAMFPWAGAMLFFGARPMRPVDLSAADGFSFRAKGDTPIRVMVFSTSAGLIPRITTVQAGSEWTDLTVRWTDVGSEGKDVQAVLFAGPAVGPAEFDIDDVRLNQRH